MWDWKMMFELFPGYENEALDESLTFWAVRM